MGRFLGTGDFDDYGDTFCGGHPWSPAEVLEIYGSHGRWTIRTTQLHDWPIGAPTDAEVAEIGRIGGWVAFVVVQTAADDGSRIDSRILHARRVPGVHAGKGAAYDAGIVELTALGHADHEKLIVPFGGW